MMETNKNTPKTIDEYIARFPPNIQDILQKIRLTIAEAAPEAEETLSYAMPTFRLRGHNIIYFAAFKKHIGLYPPPAGDEQFKQALSPYAAGKGTAQLPLDKPIPFDLIRQFVAFRIDECAQRAPAKRKKPA